MSDQDQVTEFYDKFKDKQVKTGVNLRHRTIIRSLINKGLKKNHHVLELGCGIGIISGVLSKYLRHGSVTGVDISPENILFAKKQHQNKANAEFITSDLQNFQTNKTYDCIILPDVLEHIPEIDHLGIFQKISKLTHQDTILYIHIPSPRYNEYLHTYQPELLQIIDQSLEAGTVIINAENAGFELISYKLYPLNMEYSDYVEMVFKVKKPLKKVKYITGIKLYRKEIVSKLWFLRFRMMS